MRTKRYSCIVLLATMALMLFVSSVAAAKVTITYWHRESLAFDLITEMAKEFEAANPNVEIKVLQVTGDEYEPKLFTAMRSGTHPDIVHLFHWVDLRLSQMVEPYSLEHFTQAELDEMIGPHKEYFSDDEGRLLTVPYAFLGPTIIYNRELWREAGLDEKAHPKTWKELLLVAQKLTKYDSSGRLLQAGFAWPDSRHLAQELVSQMGGALQSRDQRSSMVYSSEWIEAVSFVRDLMTEYKVYDPRYITWNEGWTQGKIGSMSIWTWFLNYAPTQAPNIEWDVFKMPTPYGKDTDIRGWTNIEGGLAVLKRKRNPEQEKAVWDFVRFILKDEKNIVELAREMGGLPANTAYWESPGLAQEPMLKVLIEEMPYLVYPGDFCIENLRMARAELEKILYEDAPIEETLDALAKRETANLARKDYKFSEWVYIDQIAEGMDAVPKQIIPE